MKLQEETMWKLFYIGGPWPYWQCRTPHGIYNFQATDEYDAILKRDGERSRLHNVVQQVRAGNEKQI